VVEDVGFDLVSTHLPRTAAIWLISAAVALTATLVATTTTASADQVRVTHTLFGMHDGSSSKTSPPTSMSYAHVHEGAVRLWDVGVQWREIELTRGHYTWTKLDQLVSQAQAAHAEVTMVVAFTPSFYASDPRQPPRNLAHYRNFVSALMHRYKNFHGSRGIANYQVWNEANVSTYWTGSMRRLAQLSRTLYDVRNRVDRRARVIAPPMVTRLPYQQAWLQQYYRTSLNGTKVWRFYDALALSLYPLPRYGRRLGVPEDGIALLDQVKRRLHSDGIPRSKPIWNTEVNYGLQSGSRGGTRAARISDARQAANIARTYLLNAANGVKRVFWYRYDLAQVAGGGALGNTLLSQPLNPAKATRVARAYVRVQHWMHGRLVGPRGKRPCQRDSRGTYTCVVTDSSGTRRIYWNPFHGATVRLAPGARHLHGLFGGGSRVRGGSRLTVDYRPVMADH
jgi:hypothetical protein